ncbi:MAG: amino acid-binding protein [Rhodospirillum sp.]|nr:amino acid-binding protein [Rhodospirillum sp.]MCF8489052.1 amino acid-binding protein [Rhodospirillum sp.]MCF8499759.1 amino acid-binding protein [Rhodospirillum sp.]
MTNTLRIALSCPDRTGLVAAVAGRLFDLGANLGDTSFATLGSTAEFTIVCSMPEDVTVEETRESLAALPELKGADLWVGHPRDEAEGAQDKKITHTIIVSGGDRPGLVTRLAEAFGEYGASIVRLTSERLDDVEGVRYVVRFETRIPKEKEMTCLATVKNTSEELGLACSFKSL